MDTKLAELMNDQINKELYSAYAYLAVAQYYASRGLDGFYSWFSKQAEEEVEHARKIEKYLQERDVLVVLKDIKTLDKAFKDNRDPLAFQVEHEAYVTSLIYNLYEVASNAKDYLTVRFLDWFVTEQGEEERTAKDLLDNYDLYAANGGLGLHELDEELGKR